MGSHVFFKPAIAAVGMRAAFDVFRGQLNLYSQGKVVETARMRSSGGSANRMTPQDQVTSPSFHDFTCMATCLESEVYLDCAAFRTTYLLMIHSRYFTCSASTVSFVPM